MSILFLLNCIWHTTVRNDVVKGQCPHKLAKEALIPCYNKRFQHPKLLFEGM
jgi:hypothetical protein